MIEALLGSRDKENVLQYLLSRGQGYASEIAKFYGTSSSQIIKQLEALEIGGVLVSFQIGRARVYQLNPRYYFLNELKALLVKVRETYKPEEQEKLLRAKTAPRRKGKPLKLLRFRQVVNRNIDKKYDIQQIVNALKGKDFISKTKEEQLIISRFFLEGTEDDLIEVTAIPGITKTSLKSIYLTSPLCKNPADTTWDKRFRVTPKKTLTSINPSSNKALQHLLNKKAHANVL